MKLFVKVSVSEETIERFKNLMRKLTGRDIPPFPWEDGHVFDVNMDELVKNNEELFTPEFIEPFLAGLKAFEVYKNKDADPAEWAAQKLSGYFIRTIKKTGNTVMYAKYDTSSGYFLSNGNTGACVFTEVNAIKVIASFGDIPGMKLEYIPVEEALQ